MKQRLRGTLLALIALPAAARADPLDARRCEAKKDQAAARYSACLLRGYARGALDSAPPDFGKCAAKQLSAWSNAEDRYGASCPSSGDQAAIATEIAEDAAAVAAEIAGAPFCGNGVVDPHEACDGANLNGQSCAALGYERGTLTCSALCGLDTRGCEIDRAPASGQTTSYTLGGDDGTVRAGHVLSYADNDDGTVEDLNTHLVWEKKAGLDGMTQEADLHDADNTYAWQCGCRTGGALCGVDADCGADGPCDAGTPLNPSPTCVTIFQWLARLNAASFAGHDDWRIPNVKELHALLDYEHHLPSVGEPLNTAGCAAACTDLSSPSCSCTASLAYWSSSSLANNPIRGWGVDFGFGDVINLEKPFTLAVRAVRGHS